MGDILIRLRGNLQTGEKEVVVEYESEADRTTVEHERRHREIVERLVRDGVVTREEVERVVFEKRQARPAAEAEREANG